MIKNIYKDLTEDLEDAFKDCKYSTTAHYMAGVIAGKAALAAELRLISLDQYTAFSDKIDAALQEYCLLIGE